MDPIPTIASCHFCMALQIHMDEADCATLVNEALGPCAACGARAGRHLLEHPHERVIGCFGFVYQRP
jgi:hypothetical protein